MTKISLHVDFGPRVRRAPLPEKMSTGQESMREGKEADLKRARDWQDRRTVGRLQKRKKKDKHRSKRENRQNKKNALTLKAKSTEWAKKINTT